MTRFGCLVSALAIGLATLATMPGTAAAATPAAAGFQAVAQTRILDARPSVVRTLTLDMSSRVPATATAVILTVTGFDPARPTSVTVYPRGADRPAVSNLDLATAETRSAQVTVALDSTRKLFVHSTSAVRLTADLAGYYATDASGKFTARSLERFLDTSYGDGPIGPGAARTADLSNWVPPSATAVTFNLAARGATANTFVTAWPTGVDRPNTSNLHLATGATTSNQVTVALGPDRKINLYNNAGDLHVAADLTGFYTPDYGALFTPMAPRRVLDTRGGSPLQPNGEKNLELASHVPANATSVVLNVTGAQATATTRVKVWPGMLGELRPYSGSNLSLAAGQTATVMVTAGIGTRAGVSFSNDAGTVHLVADLAGYFSLPPAPACVSKCVYAWGSNYSGGLGIGSREPGTDNPQPLYGLSDVKMLADGYVLRTDGTLWTWGGRAGGTYGGGYSLVPVPAFGLDDITAIGYGIALRGDGTVWTLGGGMTPPVQMSELIGIQAIAGGRGQGYALRDDGTVWSWGSNYHGELGSGAPPNFYTDVPVRVSGLSEVRSIASGGITGFAVKQDGTLWSWGYNGEGQLGIGTDGENCFDLPPTGPNCYSNVPVQVVNLTGVSMVSVSSLTSFAVLSDGTAWSWGYNRYGALGNGVDCEQCSTGTPARIVGLANARTVAASASGGFALDAEGRVWVWGDDTWDRLGPVEGTPPFWYLTTARRLSRPTGVSAIVSSGHGAGFALVP